MHKKPKEKLSLNLSKSLIKVSLHLDSREEKFILVSSINFFFLPIIFPDKELNLPAGKLNRRTRFRKFYIR